MVCEAFGLPLIFWTILFGCTTIFALLIAIYLNSNKSRIKSEEEE